MCKIRSLLEGRVWVSTTCFHCQSETDGLFFVGFQVGAFRSLVDVCFIAAMGPPGGGRNPVSDRLLRHFNFLAMPDLSDESRRTIFRPILKAYVVFFLYFHLFSLFPIIIVARLSLIVVFTTRQKRKERSF